MDLLKRATDDNGICFVVMLFLVSGQVCSDVFFYEPQMRLGGSLWK